jgi:hypothetical protein
MPGREWRQRKRADGRRQGQRLSQPKRRFRSAAGETAARSAGTMTAGRAPSGNCRSSSTTEPLPTVPNRPQPFPTVPNRSQPFPTVPQRTTFDPQRTAMEPALAAFRPLASHADGPIFRDGGRILLESGQHGCTGESKCGHSSTLVIGGWRFGQDRGEAICELPSTDHGERKGRFVAPCPDRPGRTPGQSLGYRRRRCK